MSDRLGDCVRDRHDERHEQHSGEANHQDLLDGSVALEPAHPGCECVDAAGLGTEVEALHLGLVLGVDRLGGDVRDVGLETVQRRRSSLPAARAWSRAPGRAAKAA